MNKKDDAFQLVYNDNFLMFFKDKDQNSDFYFGIRTYKLENNTLQLYIDSKPQSRLTTDEYARWIHGIDIGKVFQSWEDLLLAYSKVKTAFDDPILQAYTDEYYAEFEIIDNDSEIKPLTTKQILLLDGYLENIENDIDKLQTDENKEAIKSIISDVVELRKNLTTQSKKWVLKHLVKIWAKMTKQGTKFMKEFLSEAKKEIIKAAVKSVLENGINLLN